MNRAELCQFIWQCQKRMRSSGVESTWENYIKQGELRGKTIDESDPNFEQFERLWHILHEAARDRACYEYVLVVIAAVDSPKLKPNPEAFDIRPEEAEAIHNIVQKHS